MERNLLSIGILERILLIGRCIRGGFTDQLWKQGCSMKFLCTMRGSCRSIHEFLPLASSYAV